MYLTFEDLELPEFDPTNFSYSAYTYNSSIGKMVRNDLLSKKKIYKVRLLQQLTSGFRDITENA